jgi:hypothetical protein
MVATTLDEGLISGGERLLKQLDAAGVQVDAALWFYFADKETWKLMLSLPSFAEQGSKAAYKEIQKALPKVGQDLPFSLADVSVTTPDAPLIHLLRLAVRTGPGISHIRFSRNVINGQLIEDAFIYRL